MSGKLSKRAGGVVARAACRVDLAGGTMDMWPLYLFHPGAVVVNIAVQVMTTCRITPVAGGRIELASLDTGLADSFESMQALRSAGGSELLAASASKGASRLASGDAATSEARAAGVRRRGTQPRHLYKHGYKHALAAYLLRFFYPEGEADGGFRLETHSESPAGAGISGSSALMIATASALARFTGRRLGREQIREIAQNVEAQLIRVPTGCQDYYPALYGGVNAVQLDADGIHRAAIACDADELDQRFVLAYTGAPRQSGVNNWEVFKQHIDGDRRIFGNFERIGEIARAMRAAVASADWAETARLLREEWKLRRTNAPAIATPLIDRLIAVSRRNGAVGAKVCGAGGGGCVLFMIEPDARTRVEQRLTAEGAQILPFAVARGGVSVRESPHSTGFAAGYAPKPHIRQRKADVGHHKFGHHE